MKKAAAILALLVPVRAWANGAALPDTIAVHVHDGSRAELETTFGLLHGEGSRFTWICHEAVSDPGANVTPRYFRGPSGVLLASVPLGYGHDPAQTLYRSTDGGCSWQAVPSAAGALFLDIAFDPANPSRALAASYSAPSGTNGLWESTDAGASWAITPLAFAGRRFRSVRWSSDPQVLWATASQDTPPAAWTYRSVSGGASWTESAFTDLSSGPYLDLRAISPTDSSVAFVRADDATDALFRTTDGGVSWSKPFIVPDDILPGAYDLAGTLWIPTRNAGLYRTGDGASFAKVAGAPFARDVDADARGVWLATDDYADGFGLMQSTNGGASFFGVFRFTDLEGPIASCPAQSDEAVICAPLWPALRQKLGITPTPEPLTGGRGSCGCDLGGGAAALPAAVLGALVLAIRRRR